MAIGKHRKYRREGTLAEDVVTFITRRPGASMAEIMQLAGDEGEGNCELRFTANGGNVVCWTDMSQELVDVITGFLDNKLAHPHPAQETVHGIPMVYLMDGQWLNLPLVKKPPKNGYKKPHWLPVVFYPGDKCYSHHLRASCPNYRVTLRNILKGDADRERSNVVAEQEETKRVMMELAREREK
jgi:hypothetical protein